MPPMAKTPHVEPDLAEIMRPHAGKTGGLISALHAVQDKLGYLPRETEAAAAHVFNVSRAEVKGVVSFYSDFRRAPVSGICVRVCAAEACQAAGGRALLEEIESRYAVTCGVVSSSADLTLEPVYCLGLCSVAPAAMVGDKLLARADLTAVEMALAGAQREQR